MKAQPCSSYVDQISAILRDQFGILPKKRTIGYSKPYPNEYDLIPLPPKYRLPDFTKFSGSEGSSSIEHVSRYLAQLGMVSASEPLRVRFFAQSLTGPAFGWYTSLPPDSVRTWKQLEEQFHIQYHSEATEAGIADLTQVRQRRGETVSEYIQHFRTVKNRCYSVHLSEKEAVELAVAGLAAPLKDLTFQVEYNSLAHMVQKLTLYEQRHPELYQDKFKRTIGLVDAEEDEDLAEDQEVAVAEWTRTAVPVSCKWVKQPGPPKGFDFDLSKTEQIFDLLLKEKQLKLPEGHKIPTSQEMNGRPYCKWHHTFTHATNDCKVLRAQIQMAIESGRLIFGQFAMKVDTHPFPGVNMVDLSHSLRCEPGFSFGVNMAGLGSRHGKDKAEAVTPVARRKRRPIHATGPNMITDGMSRLPTIENCPECRPQRKGTNEVSVFKRLGPLPPQNKRAESSQDEDFEESDEEEDSIDLAGDGKLGYGFTSADELEEIDIGPGDKPRPTFISKKLDPHLRGLMIALLKEYPDCFAWDYTEMPGLDRSIIEHRLPLKKGFRPFQQRARQMKAEILVEVKKEIQKMLDAGFIRTCRFISNLSGRIEPFMGLVKIKSDEEFRWGAEQQQAFDDIKEYLTKPPVLVPPQQDRPFYIYLSVADTSIASVVVQVYDGLEKVVFYLSRRMLDAETRYPEIEKLCLCLFFTCTKIQHILLSAEIIVICKSDVIKHMLSAPVLKGRLGKWMFALSEFDIRYQPAKAVKGQALADLIAERINTDVAALSVRAWAMFFDGSVCEDGCGIGVLLVSPRGATFSFSIRIATPCTNNVAEYEAMCKGMELLLDAGAEAVEIFGDSKLVISQLTEEYKCESESLFPLWIQCRELMARFRFGIPQTITTDGGSVFVSKEFRKFCEDMGIKLIRSSPYYAQANGQAEASNKSLIKLIKRKIDEHPRRWHEVLSEALWAYRMSCHGAIKTSPYQLVYGQEAVLPWEIKAGSRRITFQNDLTAEEYAALMSDSIEDATELRLWSLEKIKENKAKVARAYNKKVKPKEFQVGDLVWEAVLPLGTKDKVYGKWSPNWHGPYKVDQVLKGNAYMLEQLDGVKFPVAVNGQHLKKYFPSMWDDGQ
ncbi:hypothetical protein QYE76_054813 [Lolium multiflorum]|uniref:Integrase catalytic domain-containing protein n=1 Tax=Lolium multiflorum TaxID=4521 RepID=A0AAD8WLC5_LOLMU|nr:hypothetical protein QYE76_054813 [Lolium multiflorum]